LGSAYDRAEFLQQRREMMQRWADYCDALRDGSKPSRSKNQAGVRRETAMPDRRSRIHASAQPPGWTRI